MSEKNQNKRKQRVGVVVSDKMNKTIVVGIQRRTSHPKYSKIISITKKIKAHDEKNSAKPGDRVRVEETRPLSKDKRWRLINILKKAQ